MSELRREFNSSFILAVHALSIHRDSRPTNFRSRPEVITLARLNVGIEAIIKYV